MRTDRLISSFLLATISVGGGSAQALADETAQRARIREDMKRFLENPREFAGELPRKTDSRGRVLSPLDSRFSESMTRSRDYVSRKAQLRRRLDPSGTLPAAPEGNDRAENVADVVKIHALEQMDHAGLREARLAESPWSDDYWALYKGGLASRYADDDFPGSIDWKVNADWVKARLTANSSSTDTLSPAEKYDLVVGDAGFGLTQTQLRAGEIYYQRYGTVESWMGYCHGWAAASYVLPRPERRIQVAAANGGSINFYPSDIKALATLLWAESAGPTRSAGRRCDIKYPKTNDNGRIIDPECFDTNPATWHLAIVNQIGVAKRSVVIDATYDYQVWNQPVVGYHYTYFNPNTGEPSSTADSLSKARVPIERFDKDKFREFRSPAARSVVGVAMDLTYTAENIPSHDERDLPRNDRTMTVRYYYDLELDASGQVIGGEWYEQAHPDFLWTPAPGARAMTAADRILDRESPRSGWDGQSAMPAVWRAQAERATRQGTPIAHVVEALVALSRFGSR